MFRDSILHRAAKRLIPAEYYPRNILARQIIRNTGRSVYGGPFRGMKYALESVGSVYYPKLLGTYEQELHPIIERIIELGPDHVVDVGAAEGYYAVGLALRLPKTGVIAFEQTAEGRKLVNEMCKCNGVQNRVTIRGHCDRQSLLDVLSGTGETVIICDVEGYEQELLDAEAISVLRQTYVLVELHEFACPGISDELASRFAPTHNVRRIWQQTRTRVDYPFGGWFSKVLPTAYATYQVQEFRPEKMSWFWMEPKESCPEN